MLKPRLIALVFLCAGLLAVKLILATQLDLYSDEIFYWWEAMHLAPAYSDLPFMTALLARLGLFLPLDPTLALRLPFILIGLSVPAIMYWLASPVVGRERALESALWSLSLPLISFLGLLAVPDVPLVAFGLLALGAFERALRSDRAAWWCATGVFVALGFATHYRFALLLAGALLFLLAFAPARRQWLNPKFWLAAAIGAVGLLPALWFNLAYDFAAVEFYFVNRHPWQFDPQGLLFLGLQVVVVTPLLFALLAHCVWWLTRNLGAGDGTSEAGPADERRVKALVLWVALTPLATYTMLAPWADGDSTTLHWPLSAYLPLLIFLPQSWRALRTVIRAKFGDLAARAVAPAAIVMGCGGGALALAAIGAQAWQESLGRHLPADLLSNKMAGWRQFSDHTRQLLAEHFESGQVVVVTDNYYTAAQLEFAGVVERAYTLDFGKAVDDGRSLQLALWERDGTALAEWQGRPALFISEDSVLDIVKRHDVIATICRRADAVRFLNSLALFQRSKVFRYYHVDAIADWPGQDLAAAGGGKSGNSPDRATPCHFPPRTWLERPLWDARLSGVVPVSGWAYNEDIGIGEVRLLVNDTPQCGMEYGLPRPDVVETLGVRTDPNRPNVGFTCELDSTLLANGKHRLELQLTDRLGVITHYGERDVYVRN